MTAPLISCIIPVHNGARYLDTTLASVFGQTHRPLEVIVVDDGSTDASADIARRYDVQLVQQTQQGPGAARNAGIVAASGDYLAFLDADDLWHPEKLTRQLARFQARPELDISVTLIQNFWEPELAEEAVRLGNHPRSRPLPGYGGSTLVARRRTFQICGSFDTTHPHSAMTAWFVNARERGAVDELLPEVLVERRLHPQGISRVGAQRSRDEHLALLKRTLDGRRAGVQPDQRATDGRPALRILLVSDNFWPVIGGAEVLIAKLLPALQERGFEFVVLTQRNIPRGDDHATYRGIPIVEHSLTPDVWKGAHEQAFESHRRVVALKRQFRPDLVHIWLANPGAVLHWQTMTAHVAPTLLTLHLAEPDERVSPRTIIGTTYRRAEWLAACSSPLLAHVRQQIPEITPRSSAVLNGIEPTTLQPEPLPWAPARLLFVGRLHPQKGVEVLLDAFASLAQAHPSVDLTIAGDGILRQALEQRAADLGIAERVEFLGWVAPDQVQPLMNQATIVIMPSRDEGLPLVALQAAQLARPIIATPAGGLADIVIHERTGLQVPIEDSATLASAIERLLGDPRLAQALGERCRAHAAQAFSWEGCLDAYAALYRRLIATGPSPAASVIGTTPLDHLDQAQTDLVDRSDPTASGHVG